MWYWWRQKIPAEKHAAGLQTSVLKLAHPDHDWTVDAWDEIFDAIGREAFAMRVAAPAGVLGYQYLLALAVSYLLQNDQTSLVVKQGIELRRKAEKDLAVCRGSFTADIAYTRDEWHAVQISITVCESLLLTLAKYYPDTSR
jgi:hypothetical protein